MKTNAYLEDTLKKKVVFFTGKGGVGKSAVAWATALLCKEAGKKVGLVSWNPLEDSSNSHPMNSFGISWEVLDTMGCFKEYTLHILKFEKIFHLVFENHVLQTFIKAMPGLSETVIAGKIWDLIDKNAYDILIVDLPASGHAMSFLKSPLGIDKIFSVGFVHKETQKICNLLKAPTTRIDLVALPEEMSVVETIDFKTKLQKLWPYPFGYVHLNQCTPEFPILGAVPEEFKSVVERQAATLQSQRQATELLNTLQMPKNEIPRFPTEKLNDTIVKVKEELSK